jgi:sulfite exporter TauE/SafE
MTCSALPLDRRRRLAAQAPYLLAYNAGRIGSYAALGAAAGALGASLAIAPALLHAQLALRLVAGSMMLAVGLYVAGLSGALLWVERLGVPLWRWLAPAARRFVPVRHPLSALALGLLWGWMPCGLVYGALATAAASGSAAAGAATMASFGLGTLPMLLSMGSAATALAQAARRRSLRVAAGVVIAAFGFVQLVHTERAWASNRPGAAHACCPTTAARGRL